MCVSLAKSHSLHIGAKQKLRATYTPNEPNYGSIWKCENWNQQQFFKIWEISGVKHDEKWSTDWGQSVGLLIRTIQSDSTSKVSIQLF